MKKLVSMYIWLLVYLIIGGAIVFHGYYQEHLYYVQMLGDGSNWLLLLWWIIAAGIPVWYRMRSPQLSSRWLLYSVVASILVFAYAFIAIRDTFVGSAYIALPLNILLMLWWFALVLGGMRSGGAYLFRHIHRRDVETIDHIILALVYGFVAWLWVSWVLVMTTMLYQLVVVWYMVACWYLIWKEKVLWSKIAHYITDMAWRHLWFSTWTKALTTVLFIMTIMYVCYGLMLAYIPYPTAWDANHAYMYFPKVWAEHHWYLWNSLSAQFSPSPRLTYVALWFQFGYAFQTIGGWIWPDTWAVVMNFMVTIIVMIFVWGLIRSLIRYLHLSDRIQHYQIWWVVLLSWMTSGMWAFLVFVDNKSDFGVLALALATLITALYWLPYYKWVDEEKGIDMIWLSHTSWAIVSWVIGATAVFAKPTSLFDFASVALLAAGVLWGVFSLVWLGLVILGLMALIDLMTVPLYISHTLWIAYMILWVALIAFGIIKKWTKSIPQWRYVVIWWVVMVGLLAILKTPLMMRRSHTTQTSIDGVWGYIKGVLMGFDSRWDQHMTSSDQPTVLLAQAGSSVPSRSCSLSSQWIDQASLYDWLLTATTEWAWEDLGRYIWYWSKQWLRPWWWFIVPRNTCIWWDADAITLCKMQDQIAQWSIDNIWSQLQWGASKFIEQAQVYRDAGLSETYIRQNLIRQLTIYWQDKIIYRDTTSVWVPYRFLVPLNITYNWSLQNLSSYYTDIGVVWLHLLVILLTGAVWLIVRDRRYALLPVATVMAWIIWWVSWSAILRYGISLIIWTMMSMIVIYDRRREKSDHSIQLTLLSSVLWLLWVIVSIQFLLNFIRIGSQWWWWVFVQYKTSNAILQEITPDLTVQPKITYGVSGKDIFDLQFPHYNKTIRAIDAVKWSKDAVLIAWTYMPYFLYNQYNIISDWFLMSFWEWMSDENVCRWYLRLQDKNIKYLVIDPNIASVAMGEWNLTLRDRIFAKIDPDTWLITQHGAMSSLARLVDAWYIELFSTNNIAAKYAFTLSDEQLQSAFGWWTGDLSLLKTQLATVRFWWEEGNRLLTPVLQLMAQRITIPETWISDIADIFGKDVDVQKLVNLTQQLSDPLIVNQLTQLNQEERYVLANYLSIVSLARSNSQQFQQQMIQLLQQSISWGSQLIVFKVN